MSCNILQGMLRVVKYSVRIFSVKQYCAMYFECCAILHEGI